MKLLFDLGNTRLKWAIWDSASLQCGGALAHADADFRQQLRAALRALPRVSSVWIASVATAALNADLVHAVRECCGLDAMHARTQSTMGNIRIAYRVPEQFGVDRFLSLIAVRQIHPGPIVLAACGTALVLDALDGNGVHLGGLIAPSPELMQRALVDAAADVNPIENRRIVEMADNTGDALHSGTWLAAAALIERFLENAKLRFKAMPELVLAGGGARELQGAINGRGRVAFDLVLRGLASYADSV